MKNASLWVIAGGVLLIAMILLSVVGCCTLGIGYQAWRKANEPPWGWEMDAAMRAP